MQQRGRVRRRVVLVLVAAVLGAGVTACGAAQTPSANGSGSASGRPESSTTARPDPSTTSIPDPSATASPTNSPQVPTDGVTLTQLGFVHGPANFSIPRGASITTASDQENTVTLVFTGPTALELAAYYRGALPATGFAVEGDRVEGETATLTFSGGGWHGSLTGRGAVSGVTLMRGPA